MTLGKIPQVTLIFKATQSTAASFLAGNHFSGIGDKPIQEKVPLSDAGGLDRLLRIGVQSDFLMASLYVAVWTTPGAEADVGIPIAHPMPLDRGSVELLSCQDCMMQVRIVLEETNFGPMLFLGFGEWSLCRTGGMMLCLPQGWINCGGGLYQQ